jgi:hypothetical protein
MRKATAGYRVGSNAGVKGFTMAITPHDAYRQRTTQILTYAAAGGSSAQSVAFGSQTYFIRIASAGVVSASLDGVRYAVGDGPVAAATSSLLPLNWVEYVKCSPGQKIAVLGNNTGTGSVSVVELTD